MPRAPYLTKSRFKMATECPRKLFYTGKAEYANTASDNEFLQQLAEGGYQVGELAKWMFPGGQEITAQGHQAQLEQTAQALLAEDVTLFEATLSHDRLFARVDVLVKQGRSIRVIEVKSKSYDPDDAYFFIGKRGDVSSSLRPYLLDVAFQTWVVRCAMPDCQVSASLLLPDKSRRATVDGLNRCFPIERIESERRQIVVRTPEGLRLSDLGEPILTEVDVTALVNRLLSELLEFPGVVGTLPELATQWAQDYETGRAITPPVQAQCKSCEFRAPEGSPRRCGLSECWQSALHLSESALQEPLVIDLWDGRSTRRWMSDGRHRLSDLIIEDLGRESNPDSDGISRIGRQWLQISGEGLNREGYLFHRELAEQAMRQWRYPLNLIDFETSRTALPFHKGERPFGLLAFQFSHHILQADGSLIHAGEFLCTEPGQHPNLGFLRALNASLSANDGTVLMWSPYENSVLNELRQQLLSAELKAPDGAELIAFIDRLTTRKEGDEILWQGDRALVDMKPLSARAFFHRRTHGSNSIKKVLPAMLQACAALRQIYQFPQYGGGRANSKNFYQPIAWWVPGPDGLPLDPYALLPPVFTDLLLESDEEDSGPSVAHGGAAMYAYARLQFEDIAAEERKAWNAALLRYCELDTLAMAMIVQGWQAWVRGEG